MVPFTELDNTGGDVSFVEEIKNSFLYLLKVSPRKPQIGLLSSGMCLRMKIHS